MIVINHRLNFIFTDGFSHNVKEWEEITLPVPWGYVAGKYLFRY